MSEHAPNATHISRPFGPIAAKDTTLCRKSRLSNLRIAQMCKIFLPRVPPVYLTSARPYRSELASFSDLVHEVIGGDLRRRHVFSQWELELLLDLQMCRVRKSARCGLLRKYLKAVQQHFAEGATVPPRFSSFVAQEYEERKTAVIPAVASNRKAHMSAGLSS